MLNPDTISQIFTELKKDPENQKCFDCDQLNSDNCLINGGIFLCRDCAVSHLSLLPELTLIKVYTMDDWTKKEVSNMIAGGNAAFREFLNYYEISKDTPINIVFRTRAAAFYRVMLDSLADGVTFKEAFPAKELGKLIYEEESKASYPELAQIAPNYPGMTEQMKHNQEQQKPKVSEKGSWLNNMFTRIQGMGNNAFVKVEELGQHPKMKDMEQKALRLVERVEKKLVNVVGNMRGVKVEDKPIVEISYLEIANSPMHTYDKINSSQNSQKIKLQAMKTLKLSEGGNDIITGPGVGKSYPLEL